MEKLDQQKRLLLAIGLSFALTIVYTTFFAKPAIPAVTEFTGDGGTTLALSLDGGTHETVAALLPTEPALADAGTVAKMELPKRELTRNRDATELTFSTEGASIVHAKLLGKKEREQQHVSIAEGYQKLFGKKLDPPRQMDLAVPVEGLPAPFSVSVDGVQPFSALARYEVVEETDTAVTFRASSGPWEIEKRFTWEKAGYGLSLLVSVKNVSAAPVSGELGLHNARRIDPSYEEKPSFFGGIGNQASVQCLSGDDLKKRVPKDDVASEEVKGRVRFTGIDQQYFLSALYPNGGREGRCVLTATGVARSVDAFFPLTVQPNEKQTYDFGLFLGPKELEVLTAVGVPGSAGSPGNAAVGASPGLEKTVDFGWWAVICKVLLVVLKFFHQLLGNWGFAIIALTVSVKVILLPLTHKAMVSAESMKKLQPQMEAIKKKFPDDRERQNVETMKLYQEAKVNPLGGCLPLLVQLPIWAALFTTLRTSYDLYGEPFVGPVWTDLTFKDPTYLLPFALGITMIITQRLQPQMMDPVQARIFTWVMPVFFTVIMMNYPCGLALYIFTNNLLSIAQQYALRRYLVHKGVAAPRPGPDDKKKGEKKVRGLKESES